MTYALEILKCVQLGTETTVNAQKLLVHDGRKRQSAERLHARLVHSLRVLVLTLELEGEVISQVAALVVAAQQP